MPKINSKVVLKTLKGEPLKNGEEDYTLGEAIANILISDDSGGKMKMYVLANKFMSGEEVEIDAADLTLIKSAAERTKDYRTILAGQVLLLLENLPE